jgi:hypothetical protein
MYLKIPLLSLTLSNSKPGFSLCSSHISERDTNNGFMTSSSFRQVFFTQLHILELNAVSLLEIDSGFEIVMQIADGKKMTILTSIVYG